MNMQMLELIRFLCIFQIMMLFILIALNLNTFLKKFKKSLVIKTCKQTYLEYKANNSEMCGYFCTGLIDFMLAGKTLIDYSSLFLLYDLKKK